MFRPVLLSPHGAVAGLRSACVAAVLLVSAACSSSVKEPPDAPPVVAPLAVSKEPAPAASITTPSAPPESSVPPGSSSSSAAPAPSQVVVSGGLSAEAIKKVVREGRRPIDRCLDDALRSTAQKSSRQGTLAWEIGVAGTVGGASFVEKKLANPKLETCILDGVRRLTFPASGMPTKVEAFPLEWLGDPGY